jgi:ribose transport system substrate-binding protein
MKRVAQQHRRSLAKRVGFLASLAMLVVLAGSGGLSTSPRAAATVAKKASKKQVNLVYFAVFKNAHGIAEIGGINETIAREKNATLTTFVSNADSQLQYRQCQDAITSGKFNAFLLVAVDGPAMVPCAKQAIKAGITVVSLATPLGADPATVRPQVPGVAGVVLKPSTSDGLGSAQLMIQACGKLNPCKVGYIFGVRALQWDVGRYATIRKVLKTHPSIRIVALGEGAIIPDTAFKAARDMLQAHPDLNVLVAAADPGARGALKAAQDAGIKGLKIVGGGGTALVWKEILAGRIFGSTVILPRTEGRVGAAIAIHTVRGEPVKKRYIDETVFSPIGPILTPKNAKRYKPEWQG